MSVVATRFERSIAPGRARWTEGAPRVLRALLGALNRLVLPPGDAPEEAELPPPEWFKYPPI